MIGRICTIDRDKIRFERLISCAPSMNMLGSSHESNDIQVERHRFFFFSREEERMHVHVTCADGEAKFWLDPKIEIARNYGLSSRQISETIDVIRKRRDEIAESWHQHFGS